MRAVVKYADRSGAVEVRDTAVPDVTPGTVLVKVAAVGVCGSDIHMWRGTQSASSKGVLPVTLGHESAGAIASVCGVCALCRSGRYNLCPWRQGYGLRRDGGMAEYFLAEPRVLHRIPEGVEFEHAALTEPFCVAYNALVERARIRPGDLVVIQGAGTIGQLAAQVALAQGAATVVMLGTAVDRIRFGKARGMGVHRTVGVTAEDSAAVVAGLHDGLGADLVVDATGVSEALRQALELVRPAGAIAKVGWGPQPLGFTLDPLVKKAVTLYGCYSHTWSTWENVLRLFGAGGLDPTSALGGVYPIEEWSEAFSAMERGDNIKSVLAPHGSEFMGTR